MHLAKAILDKKKETPKELKRIAKEELKEHSDECEDKKKSMARRMKGRSK